jgi:tricorn protease
MSLAIGGDDARPAPVLEDVQSYELTGDGRKLMVRRAQEIYVFDAGARAPQSLVESRVDLAGWSFSVDPREEWQHHFLDAWRLERDYFYDPKMHGVDWPAVLEKYRPLAARVTDRIELNDVIAQMVGELSALHIYVRGGDARTAAEEAAVPSLGGVLERDDDAGGWRVTRIYRSDPDIPAELAPLAQPGVDVHEGDVIVAIDGVSTLDVADPAVLLRNKAGRQVRLTVRSGSADPRDVIAQPASQARERDLRYDEWEYTRRLAVDSLAQGKVGYVHLRAMGGGDIAQWAREYYPVFRRPGLIIDVRHNGGGNIDSWLLGKLLRRTWFWWQPRVGEAYGNMPYAFNGPIVVLVNERTASDGEAFAEGFRKLGLGRLIGNRTWGGEIWLSQSNFLADRGIATAAEQGVYADGRWLIEGWGVDPDVVVENTPVSTAQGRDAQLEAAVKLLLQDIARKPVTTPPPPPYPDKRRRGGER